MAIRYLLLLILAIGAQYHAVAQCPPVLPTVTGGTPDNCTNALNLNPLYNVPQYMCVNNATATASGAVQNLAGCLLTDQRDLFFVSYEPCTGIPGFNRSFVFRWENWPNRATGAAPPRLAAHAEVAGSIAIINVSYDCTSPAPTQNTDFAAENIYCNDGEQFYLPPNTVPCTPFSLAVPGVGAVNVNDLGIFFHAVTSDGGVGDLCFQVSSYQQGFLCGDATPLTLSGNNTQVTATATACLGTTALNGTILSNLTNNIPVPCGVETPASAWYQITLPYTCNKVDISLGNWGGNGGYNIALLSAVNCPGSNFNDPITGQTSTIPGQTLDPGTVVEAGVCGQPLNICRPLPAGTYWVYISGATERPTFTVNVTVTNATPVAGTAISPQNGGNVCSGGNININTAGTNLAFAACGDQTLDWYYSPNVSFNPYNGQGVYLGSGIGALAFPLPVNNNCAPQTYYIKGVVSDSAGLTQTACPGSTNTLSVTVYPTIGQATIVNNTCAITVAGRCPAFTVNGQPGSFTFIAGPQDDGTVQSFVISNGLASCNTIVTDTVRCNIQCTQPSATAQTVCNGNDPFNFYVNVAFAPGSATTYFIESSDGSSLPVSTAGNYQIGPFANGNPVTITVTNSEDPSCNLPLGSFVDFCNPTSCPNLTSAFVAVTGGGTNVCEGSNLLLQASVDQGVLNQDYTIQWYVNGQPITGATLPFYSHVVSTDQGCSPEIQQYSVQVFCLDANAAPANVTTLNATPGALTVYPRPDFGLDFVPSPQNCTVAPVDVCGGLTITYSPLTNPAPGAPATTVNYTVSVPGAPAGCTTTGNYSIQCPAATCTQIAGTGQTPADNDICFGETFTLSSTGQSAGSGYMFGYAYTTTNPFGNLEQAVTQAVQLGNVTPMANANVAQQLVNGNGYGPGDYYFIPFVSLNVDDQNPNFTYQQSGSLNIPAFGSNSVTITVPTLPFCPGITSYVVTFSANQTSGIGNPIDNVGGGLLGYGGGATTSVNLSNNNYTNNPSGQTLTMNCSSTFGANVAWNFTIRPAADIDYPTICPTCLDAGNPVVYNLLPQISLTPQLVGTICAGDSANLNDYNPISNIPGQYTWSGANPNQGGTPLANTTVAPTLAGNTYWVTFAANADTSCQAVDSLVLTATDLPAVNVLAAPAPICQGDAVNLTLLNAQVTNAPGSFTWFRGNPVTNPFAVQLPNVLAQNQQPSNGATYCCRFTDLNTGCNNYTCVTYTVNPLPSLTPPVVQPNICPNGTFDLTSLQAGLTADAGTFAWYTGDPGAGGTLVANPAAVTSGGQYCAVFTEDLNGCSNKVCINLGTHPLPVLSNLTQQGPICSGDEVDLTSLQINITGEAGSFDWYLGNPATNGVPVANPTAATPAQGNVFYVVFTNTITGCRNTATVTFTVNPSPALVTPNLPALCAGTTVSLVALEPAIATGAGTFQWFADSVQLSFQQAQNQVPTGNETYVGVFTNGLGCSNEVTLGYTVNPLPVLTAQVVQDLVCNGTVVNLSNFQAPITTEPGTFAWFGGNTQLNAAAVQAQTLNADTTYTAVFTATATNCSASTDLVFDVLAPVAGTTATYDCAADQIVVNFNNTTGGAGGYLVSANSPNQNGETVPNGGNWTILVTDSVGCPQAPLTGTVNCITCAAGTAISGIDTLCCGQSTTIGVSGSVLLPGNVVAWALTPSSSGPVEDAADAAAADAAGLVFQANPDGSLTLSNGCSLPAGPYFATPFVAENPVINPIVWDTLNGCFPRGQICPVLIADPIDPNWIVDTFIAVYPNGDTMDVVMQLTQALFPPNGISLDITQGLLDGFFPGGSLPCLPLDLLYNGNPNGLWTLIVSNAGTGALTFQLPDFVITVDADTCLQLNGVDQVVTVPGSQGVVQPGGTVAISFIIPPLPGDFPTINPACESYGAPVSIVFDNCVGLSEPSLLGAMRVFPNPSTGAFSLSFDRPVTGLAQVFDLQGRLIHSQSMDATQQARLDLGADNKAVPNGLYLLRVVNGAEVVTRQIEVHRP